MLVHCRKIWASPLQVPKSADCIAIWATPVIPVSAVGAQQTQPLCKGRLTQPLHDEFLSAAGCPAAQHTPSLAAADDRQCKRKRVQQQEMRSGPNPKVPNPVLTHKQVTHTHAHLPTNPPTPKPHPPTRAQPFLF